MAKFNFEFYKEKLKMEGTKNNNGTSKHELARAMGLYNSKMRSSNILDSHASSGVDTKIKCSQPADALISVNFSDEDELLNEVPMKKRKVVSSTQTDAPQCGNNGIGSTSKPPVRLSYPLGAVTRSTPYPATRKRCSKSPSQWTVDDVANFLRSTPNCSIYVRAFTREAIDGEALLLLTHITCTQPPLSMKLGHALKLLDKIPHRLAPESNSNSSTSSDSL